MDYIANFLQQYWGVTLFGGVTFGSLIALLVKGFKVLANVLKGNANTEKIGKVMEDGINKLTKENSILNEKLIESENKRLAENEQAQKVQAVTFEALSYLLMSSRLPNEDKLTMIDKFKNVTGSNINYEQVQQASNNVQGIIDEAKQDAVELKTSVEETINKSQSLLEKYKDDNN